MSERLYALLLQLYPRGFLEQYQAEMQRLFRDRLRNEPAWRVWLDVLRDALVSIPLQHCTPQPHPMFPASAAPLRAAMATLARDVLLLLVLIYSSFIAVAVIAGKLMQPFAAWSSVVWIALALALCVSAVVARPAFRMVCRSLHAMRAFRAIADDEAITVFYDGATPSTLQRSEVVEAHDYTFTGMRIRATDPARDLWVPRFTKAYAEVKAVLGTWHCELVDSGLNPRPPILAYAVWLLAYVLPAAFLQLTVSWFFAAVWGITLLMGALGRSGQPLLYRMLPLTGIVVVVVRSMH